MKGARGICDRRILGADLQVVERNLGPEMRFRQHVSDVWSVARNRHLFDLRDVERRGRISLYQVAVGVECFEPPVINSSRSNGVETDKARRCRKVNSQQDRVAGKDVGIASIALRLGAKSA